MTKTLFSTNQRGSLFFCCFFFYLSKQEKQQGLKKQTVLSVFIFRGFTEYFSVVLVCFWLLRFGCDFINDYVKMQFY